MDVGSHTFESEHRIITLLGEIFYPSWRGFDPDHQYFLLTLWILYSGTSLFLLVGFN